MCCAYALQANVEIFVKKGGDVKVAMGAGAKSGYSDEMYQVLSVIFP